MTFAQDWDTLQIQQWYDAQNEYAVLSTYVADSTNLNEDGSMKNVNGVWEVPHLCSIQWENGHVRNMQAKAARLLKNRSSRRCGPPGLSFSRCHAERTVPYDPYTPYIFWGEEFSRTARFFTRDMIYILPQDAHSPRLQAHAGRPDALQVERSGRASPEPQSNDHQAARRRRTSASGRCWACRAAIPLWYQVWASTASAPNVHWMISSNSLVST